jgi:lysophospholipase L1-like esterase
MNDKETLIMLGDSLTEGWRWDSLKPEASVINLGVSGDSTMGVRCRLNRCAELKPKKIFLQVGINDLSQGRTPEEVAEGHFKIWRELAEKLPQAELSICSLTPINEKRLAWPSESLKNSRVEETNRLIKEAAEREGLIYVDLHAAMADGEGSLPDHMTDDGVHLARAAYEIWMKTLKPIVA